MNSLGQEIKGKHVVLKNKYYKGDTIERVFLCEGGFGCSSFTLGGAVIGTFIFDESHYRVGGDEVERFATEEEVEEAKKRLSENCIAMNI